MKAHCCTKYIKLSISLTHPFLSLTWAITHPMHVEAYGKPRNWCLKVVDGELDMERKFKSSMTHGYLESIKLLYP